VFALESPHADVIRQITNRRERVDVDRVLFMLPTDVRRPKSTPREHPRAALAETASNAKRKRRGVPARGRLLSEGRDIGLRDGA
jgi:hypothetical protein